jgi:cyclase
MALDQHAGHGSGHDDAALSPPVLEQVSEDVYSYVQPDGTWFINNTGFVVGDHGVVVVDTTSTEARNLAFIDAIRSVTDLPVTTVVNTHHHADHTHGNYLFEGAAVVAHRRCREVMLETGAIVDYSATFPGVVWGDLRFRAPDITFEGGLDLHAGDLLVQLHDIGYTAHTTGDVVAWLPERRVLFSGDLVFHGGTPFALFGSVQGTLDALDRLEAFGAEVLVPGHGPATTGAGVRAALQDQRDYLRFVQSAAAEGMDADRTPLEQARSTDLGRFAGWTDPERLAGNLHSAYRDAGRNDGFTVAGAIADMVSYNGGALPRCLA